MDEMGIRNQRAAESILGNEALTADLDDEAAKVLIQWGISRARRIVGRTGGMSEDEAERAMYKPMRALRKMLRTVNKLAISQDINQLERFLDRASAVYGGNISIPGRYERSRFLMQLPREPAERIAWLRWYVEPRRPTS